MSKKIKNKKNSTTSFLLIVGIIIVSLFTKIPQKIIKKIQLISFYNNLTNYEKGFNSESIYKLLTPEYKRIISLNDFIIDRNQSTKPYSQEFQVHSYKIVGNKGLIDRTVTTCDTKDCVGTSRRQSRTIKEYLYINWKWYIPKDNTVLCTRDEPYPMQPEFERALSLIIQRFSQSTSGGNMDGNIQKIKNCIYISYSSEVDKYNAEGLFTFDNNSTNDKLNILVSNNYKANDDILTATLLTHELTHALNYAFGFDNVPCFGNEADAFFNQILFVTTLNKAEKDSLISRKIIGGNKEVDNLFELIESTNWQYSKDKWGDILKVIKNNPYYQEQCSNN